MPGVENARGGSASLLNFDGGDPAGTRDYVQLAPSDPRPVNCEVVTIVSE